MDVTLPDDLQVLYDRLTDKQQRFVDLWTGNAEETAKLSGYMAPNKAGERAMKHVGICRLIQEIRKIELKPLIATREDRQKFWTETMVDTDEDMKYRQKASELLGKSEGDFIERRVIEGAITVEQRLRQIIEEKKSE